MTTTYEKLHKWGALGAYPLSMSEPEIEAAETSLRQLVAAVAKVRGIEGSKGKQSRQAIARKLRAQGLASGYADSLRLELAAKGGAK